MSSYYCCICGKYMRNHHMPDEWLTLPDGTTEYFHLDCYKEVCRRGQKSRNRLARKVSRAGDIHGSRNDQLKVGS